MLSSVLGMVPPTLLTTMSSFPKAPDGLTSQPRGHPMGQIGGNGVARRKAADLFGDSVKFDDVREAMRHICAGSGEHA